jgi:hypothetical protein
VSEPNRRLAGLLLVLIPTVVAGGYSLLAVIDDPAYRSNELRQDLWRAGHAHAGVLLILALVALRYLDDARLGPRAAWVARHAIPAAAIVMPLAFFTSITDTHATEPNAMILLAPIGGILLAAGTVTLGVGLLRRHGAGQDRTAGPPT